MNRLTLTALVTALICATATGATNTDNKASKTKDSETATRSTTTLSSDSLNNLVIGNMAMQRNDAATAYSYYVKELNKHPSVDLAKVTWELAVQTNNKEYLTKATDTWLKLAPKDPTAHRAKLSLAVIDGNKKVFESEANYILNEAKTQDAKAKWIVQLTNSLLNSPQSIALGASYLNNLWSEFEKNPEVVDAHARFERARNNDKLACELGRQASKLAPNDQKIFKSAVDMCWKIDPANTITMLKAFVEKHPDNKDFQLILARAYTHRNMTKQGLDILHKLVKKYPDDPFVFENAGLIAHLGGNNQLAKAWLERHIKLVEQQYGQKRLNQDNVFISLGNIYFEEKNYSKAIETFSKLKSGSEYFTAQGRILDALNESKQYDKALEQIEKMEKNPLFDTPAMKNKLLRVRADNMIATGHINKALDMILPLALKEHDIALKANTLRLGFATNRLKDVEPIYKELANQKTPSAGISLLKIEYNIRADHNLNAARHELEELYKVYPLNPQVTGVMALLCLKEKRYDQALNFAMNSLKQNFNPNVVKTLLQTLIALKRTNDVEQVYAQLLQRSQNFPPYVQWGKELGITK